MQSKYAGSPARGAQQPTPPTTSNMFATFEPHGPSQSPSPLTTQPPSSDMLELQYMGTSPGAEDVPPQAAPYFGTFGVSDSSDIDPSSHFQSSYPFMDDTPAYYQRQQADAVSAAPMYSHVSIPTMAAPILNHPKPEDFHHSHKGAMMQAIPASSMIQIHQPGQMYGVSAPAAKPSDRHRRKNRVTKRAPVPRRASSAAFSQMHKSPSRDLEGDDQNVPALRLSEKATEDERILFDLRMKYRSDKGKGMWAAIGEDYRAHTGRTCEKEALQMKVNRAVRKHAIWPEEEVRQPRTAGVFFSGSS
jgi:hypothetical protein